MKLFGKRERLAKIDAENLVSTLDRLMPVFDGWYPLQSCDRHVITVKRCRKRSGQFKVRLSMLPQFWIRCANPLIDSARVLLAAGCEEEASIGIRVADLEAFSWFPLHTASKLRVDPTLQILAAMKASRHQTISESDFGMPEPT